MTCKPRPKPCSFTGARARMSFAPKDKKALRWPSGQGGGTHFVFARFARHPGYEGDAWLVKAADEAVRQFDAIVRRVQGAI